MDPKEKLENMWQLISSLVKTYLHEKLNHRLVITIYCNGKHGMSHIKIIAEGTEHERVYRFWFYPGIKIVKVADNEKDILQALIDYIKDENRDDDERLEIDVHQGVDKPSDLFPKPIIETHSLKIQFEDFNQFIAEQNLETAKE